MKPATPSFTPPPLRLLFGEARAAMVRPFRMFAPRRLATGRDGGGRPVMVIPGFLAQDLFTLGMRMALADAGYRPHGWGLGLNRGATPALVAQLCDRLEAIAGSDGAPVSLIGWSLGGVYARELAKLRPALVDRVITLGSPFSGDPRANRAWRLYEWVSGYAVDAPPVEVDQAKKPPVKTFALWSAEDGVVAAECARGEAHEADHRVQVECRHLTFLSAPHSVSAIFDALEA